MAPEATRTNLTAIALAGDLRRLGSPARARAMARYFKTGKGEYGEGDIFFGVTTPAMRDVARKYRGLPLHEIENLLKNKVHECRSAALVILTWAYGHAGQAERERIFRFYHSHTRWINNWDLVDISAGDIVGEHLLARRKAKLARLARSRWLWDRRIAIIATGAFIARGRFKDTLNIARILLHDEQDLIHKAVGWMLREVGKRSLATEEKFLARHAGTMPRTMLRYAIEKFPARKRAMYMAPGQRSRLRRLRSGSWRRRRHRGDTKQSKRKDLNDQEPA